MNIIHTYRLLGIAFGIAAGLALANVITQWPELDAARRIAWLVVAITLACGCASCHAQAEKEGKRR